MTHEQTWKRLPDLLDDRDEPELLAHVAACHRCQRQLFLLGRVDRLLRDAAPARRKERRRARARRWLRLSAGLVAVAAVALLLFFLPHGTSPTRKFTLRTASGQPVGRAVLVRADADNMSLALVARGLPSRRAVYVLWGGGDGRPASSVGRFMVDMSGGCRVRFNLAGGHTWTRFWITPPDQPGSVVAST